MRRPDEPVSGGSAGDGLASRALRLAFRFYLPVAAATCMVLAVLLVLGAPEVSRGASLIALGAVGVGALAIAARSLWGPREPRSPSSQGDPLRPAAPGEAPSVPPERRPDLNQRFLPLHSTVHRGPFRSGGPVVAVVAVPAPGLLRGETRAPAG